MNMSNKTDELHLTELNDEELGSVSGGGVPSPYILMRNYVEDTVSSVVDTAGKVANALGLKCGGEGGGGYTCGPTGGW
jgi:hypothetical protein